MFIVAPCGTTKVRIASPCFALNLGVVREASWTSGLLEIFQLSSASGDSKGLATVALVASNGIRLGRVHRPWKALLGARQKPRNNLTI